jgi:hypothetical protein
MLVEMFLTRSKVVLRGMGEKTWKTQLRNTATRGENPLIVLRKKLLSFSI